MDKGKVIEAITEWFNANYEINIDYSTMIINIKEKQEIINLNTLIPGIDLEASLNCGSQS